MDRKLSEQELDRIAENLLHDFAPDDETLDEIADSPKLWWNVRNSIEAEKTRRAKTRFLAFRRPVFAFGALAMVLGLGLTILFLSANRTSNGPIAQNNSLPASKQKEADEDLAKVSPRPAPSSEMMSAPEKTSLRNQASKPRQIAKRQNDAVLTKRSAETSKKESLPKAAVETKTDFIALSYAASTESGQIVRVKVPSSMMVSLGVANNVEKNAGYVNAEVIVGDDGMARAIRFIR